MNGAEHLGATLVVPSREDGILETGLHSAESGFQVGTRRYFQDNGSLVERAAPPSSSPTPRSRRP